MTEIAQTRTRLLWLETAIKTVDLKRRTLFERHALNVYC